MKTQVLLTVAAQVLPGLCAYAHPGLLHTRSDLDRIAHYVSSGVQPQLTGWQKLATHISTKYTPQAASVICRGASWCNPENYIHLDEDAFAAYVNAVYWAVTGNTTYADTAGSILDAWSSTLTTITGSTDLYLVAGLQGYQLANAAEILRGYSGWKGFNAAVKMMETIFLPLNYNFTTTHIGWGDVFWANWGLANLCSQHAIGVLSDNQTAVNAALNSFVNGTWAESLHRAVWYTFTEDGSGKHLGQGQEAGRDQGHATLDFALLGVLAQQAYNQGTDLFSANNNLILAGAEYAFKYNVNQNVPFEPYDFADTNMTVISSSSRGTIRPIGELLYAHYNGIKRLNASWTGAYRDMVVSHGGGAEGGGSDYGTTSGAYDQLGFGTALFRLE